MASIARASWRRRIGIVAALSAVIFICWLLLALFSDVPTPRIPMLDQSGIRLLAELTVVSLLVAAIGFWEN